MIAVIVVAAMESFFVVVLPLPSSLLRVLHISLASETQHGDGPTVSHHREYGQASPRVRAQVLVGIARA